jgi:leader peptidase (prepilin peptidase)/N-methyltransferase
MHEVLNNPLLVAAVAFIVGAMIGSLLNVCILRLPLEKSLLWPSSRCLKCLHPIRALDNLPLIGYLRLGGKCRRCGAPFSSRYFWIELLTGAVFAVTLYFWLTLDQHRPANASEVNYFANVSRPALLLCWAAQAVFFCFLLVVAFCDLDHQVIPLTVTGPGTVAGILLSLVLPWPYPIAFEPSPNATYGGLGTPADSIALLPTSAQPWPAWLPAPSWAPPGTPQFGLLTALFGAAFGAALMRGIRWVFSWGFGKEAMGLGDADLMMMIGAFLGWQACVLVLLYGVAFGVVYALGMFIVNRRRELPFGPFLALGALLVAWGPSFGFVLAQRFFFDGLFVIGIAALGTSLALIMCFLIRTLRLIRLAG